MSIRKLIMIVGILASSTLSSDFQQSVGYTIFVPTGSTWGLFNGQGAVGATLAATAGVDSLQKCTIINNEGKAGKITGTLNEIQIVPSLPKGVRYWNPLSQINAIQKCFLATFVPNQGQLTPTCQSPEVIMIDQQSSSTTLPRSTGASLSSVLNKRYNAISSQENSVFGKEYEALYGTVSKDINDLITIKESMTDTDDFFSVLYLKFAATYGNQFVNQAAIQQASQTIFGSDIDMSSYFQGGIFPVACDLADPNAVNNVNVNVKVGHWSSTTSAGPLIRALAMGLLNKNQFDVTSLLKQPPAMTYSDVQQLIEQLSNGTGTGNMVYNRACVTELFFLYLSVLMGSNLIVGAPTYDRSFCADGSCPGNTWCPIPSPCEKMNTIPFSFYSTGNHQCFAQVCSQLAAAARYMSIIHSDQATKNRYVTQPVDRFYGMIVLNQSSYTLASNDTMIAPGQVGMLKGAPGVDMWYVSGINPDSNYRYRSVSCNLVKNNENKWVELRVEENFDQTTYDVTKTYVPAVTIRNGSTQTQRDIVSKGYLENFFKVDPGVGWAVVLQMVEQPADDGTSSIVLNMVGLARLNPYDFPLVYRGPGLDTISVGAFSAEQIFQAPFLVYAKIVASQNKQGSWPLCLTDTPPQLTPLGNTQVAPFTIQTLTNTKPQTVTPDPINPYYIAYKSALSADFGSKGTLQMALQNTITPIKKSYFTLDDLAMTPLVKLIKEASNNPHDTIVQITTTKEYRLTT